jgi:hypothetical protein
VLHQRDPADRPVARLGAGEQLGAAVRGVGPVFGETARHEQVGDALHGLPGQAHPAPDGGHAARLVQHAAEHLPPRGREPALRGELLGGLQQPAVEAEGGDDEVGQQPRRLAVRRGLGPALARRDGGAHAAAPSCMSAGYAVASPRAKTAS